MTKNRQGYFNARSLFCGLGLSLIYKNATYGFWIAEIIGFLLGLLTVIFVKKTNSSRIVKSVNGFVLALLSTFIISYLSSSLYLNATPNLILALVAVLACMIISFSKSTSLKKTYFLLFLFCVFSFLLSQSLLIKNVDFAKMLPLYNGNITGILSGAAIFYLASVTPLLVLNDVSDKKNLILNYCMAGLSIILSSLLIVLVSGLDEAMLYRYPQYNVLKRIDSFNFFTNVDNLFVSFLITDLVVTGSSAIKAMDLQSKFSKSIIFVLLTWLTTIISSHAKYATGIFETLPIILVLILVPTLIPKKNKYKEEKSNLK